jgi:methionyl-tRNA synthetase
MEPDGDSSAGEDTGATGWLLNPRCKLDGATPERRKTKHLYLRLDALQGEIVDWVGKASEGWSQNCKAITQSWIDKGLKPRGITRDLQWGVPSMFNYGKFSLLLNSIPNILLTLLIS